MRKRGEILARLGRNFAQLSVYLYGAEPEQADKESTKRKSAKEKAKQAMVLLERDTPPVDLTEDMEKEKRPRRKSVGINPLATKDDNDTTPVKPKAKKRKPPSKSPASKKLFADDDDAENPPAEMDDDATSVSSAMTAKTTDELIEENETMKKELVSMKEKLEATVKELENAKMEVQEMSTMMSRAKTIWEKLQADYAAAVGTAKEGSYWEAIANVGQDMWAALKMNTN